MISNNAYIAIQGWMINELNLSGNELMVYALVYGFSQDGKSDFHGGIGYIQSWINCGSPTTVKSTLKSLVKKGHIEKSVEYKEGTRHAIGCRYFASICHQISPNMPKGERPQFDFDAYRAEIERLTSENKDIEPDIPDTNDADIPDFMPDGLFSESDFLPNGCIDNNIPNSEDGSNSVPSIQNNRGSNSDGGTGQILTHGGSNSVPEGGQILSHGGSNSDPNNINNIKDTAAIYISPGKAADRVFGENCFDENFGAAAAAFLSKQNISDFEEFFRYIKAKADAKKPDNMRSYVYRLIFQPDVCAEFRTRHETTEKAEHGMEPERITCPACGERFHPAIDSCPKCGLSVGDWKNEARVERFRKFQKLSDSDKSLYESKYHEFRSKLVSEHGPAYFMNPSAAEAEKAFAVALDKEFGVA